MCVTDLQFLQCELCNMPVYSYFFVTGINQITKAKNSWSTVVCVMFKCALPSCWQTSISRHRLWTSHLQPCIIRGYSIKRNLDSDLVNVLGMHACIRIHDNLSCTCLQNYMIVYTNMAAVTKFTVNNNKTTTLASKTFWRLNTKLSNNLQQMNFTEDSS